MQIVNHFRLIRNVNFNQCCFFKLVIKFNQVNEALIMNTLTNINVTDAEQQIVCI